MPTVTLYTKPDCPLCEIAKERILHVSREIPFDLREVDITQDVQTFERYQHRIPVVEIDGVEAFVYRVSERLLKKRLRRLG